MSKNSDLKLDNTHLVRKCFYDGRVWTKNELSLHTGLSLAATTNILQFLLSKQEIEFVGEAESTGGRKRKQYRLYKDYTHLGMMILKRSEEQDYFLVKVSSLVGKVLWEKTYVSDRGDIDEIIEIVREMLKRDALISTLVLSIPGVCQDGKIDICDFEQLAHLDFVGRLRQEFSLSVMIENDVNAACLGLSQRYPDIAHLAFIYQPQMKYVGCGMVIHHCLYDGFSHFAGELSYVPFLSFQQQDQMLKEDPQQLLLYQILTLCAVMNPQVIGVCSDVLGSFDDTLIGHYLSDKHHPHIIFIKDLDEYIKDGLFDLGRKMIMDRRGERGNGEVY